MNEFENTEVKENLNEMRLLNEKINNLIEQRTELYTKCFGIKESLEYEQENLENLKNEIDYRKQELKEVEKKLLSITNKNVIEDSKKYTLDLKNEMIKKNLEEIFLEKLPELTNLYNSDNLELNDKSDFYNLAFESVVIYYDTSQNSKSNNLNNPNNNINLNNNNNNNKQKEEKQSFRISKTTTFQNLKSAACMFWNLQNKSSDYCLCDEAEALIYNEETPVDKYLKEYSILANKLKLVNLNIAKTRSKLLDIQQQRIHNENTFSKNTQNKGNFPLSGVGAKETAESVISKTKVFLNEFSGIKNYLINKGAVGTQYALAAAAGKVEDNQNDANNLLKSMETSFPMMIVLLILYVFTLLFLFSSRSVSIYFNYNQNLRSIFDNLNVNSNKDLYKYLVDKIGVLYFEGGNLKNVFANVTENLVEPFKAMNYTQYISTKAIEKDFVEHFPLDFSTVKNEENKRINISKFYMDVYGSHKSSNYFSIVESINIITSKVLPKECSQYEAVKEMIGESVCHEVFHNYKTSLKNNSFGLFYKEPFSLQETNESPAGDKYSVFYDFGYQRNYMMNITLSVRLLNNKNSILTMMLFLYNNLPIHESFDKFITNEAEFTPKDDINNYFLVGPDVRNIMIYFTIFDDDSQLFTFCNISFDFLPTGIIKPNIPIFKNYVPDIYSKQNTPIISDIIRTLTILFFVFIQFFEMRKRVIEAEKWWHPFIDLGLALNIVMVLIFSISIVTKYSEFTRGIKSVFENSEFLDFNLLCDKYKNLFILESIFFCFVSLKFLVFLNLNKNFGLVHATISNAIQIFAKFSVFYFIFVICYAFLFNTLLGPYLIEFSQLKSSIVQVLLFTMGYIDIQRLIAFNTNWTVFFLCLFYLYVLFFMYTVFNCIYIESLRRYIVKYGYPEDHKHKNWTMNEFTIWCTNIINIPNKKDKNKKNK